MKQGDKDKHYERAEKLLSEQNFTAAIIAGVAASVLAAVTYSIVVGKWSYSYGFAAAGIGIMVGLPMQFLGRGIEKKFAVAAAIFTIFGCFLGKIFGVVPPLEIFQSAGFLQIVEKSFSYLSGVELVFWFVSVFAAVFLAMRPLSRSDRLAIGTYQMKN